MEDINFIGHIFPQNCGDSLIVLKKTNKKNKNGNYLFNIKFLKYKYESLEEKKEILKGTINNPQIEKVEFIDKIHPQNCGDSLRIIEKIRQNNKTLFRCEFLKYPCEIVKRKDEILKGSVLNPQIEKIEFIDKIWPQKCGDSLRIIEKKEKGNWLCKFLKYPYEIIASKKNIILGQICNPQIEIEEFVNKIWPQNCGDSLRIVKKTYLRKNSNNYLWECEFIKYPYKVYKNKIEIVKGNVFNELIPWNYKEGLISFIKDNFKKKPTLQELSKIFNIHYTTIEQKIIKFSLQNLIQYYPESSYKEQELGNFILSFNIESNSDWSILNGKEIDIFIPSLNLGFEYNGNYWHSELFKQQNYHQEKSLQAQEKGINLIHIWEWEWLNKEDLIKSFIKSKLGIFDKKIYARKCEVKNLDNKTYQDFCNKNHLQGECGAKIKLGLFFKEELVQIISFGVPRFTDKYDWEIIRECSKLGYCVIGGKEKLWSYFVKNFQPKNCISYCDFSKFTGNSYLKLGFKKERLNKPGFWWYDEKTKQVFQRTPEKNQEMKEKYIKIYDAGQLVFVWNN